MIKNTNTEKTPESLLQELEKQVEDLATQVLCLSSHINFLEHKIRNLAEYQSSNGRYLSKQNTILQKAIDTLSEMKKLYPPDWILCPKCGNRIDRDDNFCCYCGSCDHKPVNIQRKGFDEAVEVLSLADKDI